mgnify:CR=1 FL=1
MATLVAVAVLHGDTPDVLVADDVDTLHWIIALRFVAQTPPSRLENDDLEHIRTALREERWGDAVERWMRATDAALDVYASETLTERSDLALAEAELQFTPLFRTT